MQGHTTPQPRSSLCSLVLCSSHTGLPSGPAIHHHPLVMQPCKQALLCLEHSLSHSAQLSSTYPSDLRSNDTSEKMFWSSYSLHNPTRPCSNIYRGLSIAAPATIYINLFVLHQGRNHIYLDHLWTHCLAHIWYLTEMFCRCVFE